jgi:hypothetical protein
MVCVATRNWSAQHHDNYHAPGTMTDCFLIKETQIHRSSWRRADIFSTQKRKKNQLNPRIVRAQQGLVFRSDHFQSDNMQNIPHQQTIDYHEFDVWLIIKMSLMVTESWLHDLIIIYCAFVQVFAIGMHTCILMAIGMDGNKHANDLVQTETIRHCRAAEFQPFREHACCCATLVS